MANVNTGDRFSTRPMVIHANCCFLAAVAWSGSFTHRSIHDMLNPVLNMHFPLDCSLPLYCSTVYTYQSILYENI